MGTTRTALLNESGVQLAYVLAIEGFSYLITDSADIHAAKAAWAGTQWNTVIGGLQVIGNIERRCEPFSNDLDVPSLMFRCLDADGNDDVGRAMFWGKPTTETRLTDSFVGNADNIPVKTSGAFPETGTVYVGNKAITYSAKNPTGFTPETVGAYSPFGADGSSNFPEGAKAPGIGGAGQNQVATSPYVSATKRSWNGSMVGLWVHQIVGGVWDTQAQAELLFAGRITDVQDAILGTELRCDGIEAKVADTVLLEDQWTARLQEGYRLLTGHTFDMRVIAVTSAGGTSIADAAQFSPPADGYYTVDEIAEMLSGWLNADADVGGHRWDLGVVSTGQGPRFRIALSGSTASTFYQFRLDTSSTAVTQFLGFDDNNTKVASEQGEGRSTLTGTLPPRRVQGLSRFPLDETLDVVDAAGTFHDLTSYLPATYQDSIDAGEVWSLLSIGDASVVLARKDSSTSFSGIELGRGGLQSVDDALFTTGVSYGQEVPLVKQIAVLTGSFSDLITRLIASTDGEGTNHATHDVLPFGAGIPWGLLGDSWTDSVDELEQSSTADALTVVVEKPLKLWDIIKADLALRGAFFVWRNGGLQLGRMQTPNASDADWELTEANKAVGEREDARTSTKHTSEMLVNNVKIEYDRDPLTDEYRSSFVVRDAASVSTYGLSKPLTIKARNCYAGTPSNGASVEELADRVAAMLPAWSRPLKRIRRSIGHNHFFAAPGDTAALTDDWVRDPSSGARGIVARGTAVLGVSFSPGISDGAASYQGTIDLLYTEEDRIFPMAPCAESIAGSGAWDAGTLALTCEAHAYSPASASVDASRFAAGDAVRVTEVDPADPASADSFTDTVASVAGSAITLTAGFGGANPAFDSAKRYLVTYDSYSACQDSQLTTVFQSDNADGRIEDLADPCLWAEGRLLGATAADTTDLPSLHAADHLGEGEPLHPALVEHVALMVNNLERHKTAHSFPLVWHGASYAAQDTGGDSIWNTVTVIPWLCAPRNRGTKRPTLSIAPMFAAVSGTAKVRVTSSRFPPRGASMQGVSGHVQPPLQMATWSTVSTTMAVQAAAELPVVMASGLPFTYLTIDVAGDIAGLVIPELRLTEAT